MPKPKKKTPSILAARIAATAIELECETRRLVSLALRGVADSVRPMVTGEPSQPTPPEIAALPESVRRLVLERTAPLFELFGCYSPEMLATLDDLALFFAERCEPAEEARR